MNGLALGLDFTQRLKVIQHMWVINPLSPYIHKQILQTSLYTFL